MKSSSPLLTENFLKKAISIASYYGFQSIEQVAPRQMKSPMPIAGRRPKDIFGSGAREILSRWAHAGTTPAQALLLYHIRADERDVPLEEHNKRSVCLGLSIVGMEKGIAEALILHTTASILHDLGVKTFCVHLNSVGDKDSAARFTREATNYLHKNINNMPSALRTAFKKDIYSAFEMMAHKEHPLFEEMPKPMRFLSDASRRHLREVIEHLETIDIPYILNDTIIGNKDFYNQTLYEVRVGEESDGENSIRVARGGRCDEMARQFFINNFPMVGIVIEGGRPRRLSLTAKVIKRRPRFYLAQIGSEAKLHILPLIEILRRARIPLYQSLNSSQLLEQLATAKELGVPYSLIVGQREMLDNTIIIRDMSTQAQKTIPLDTLPAYLKSI